MYGLCCFLLIVHTFIISHCQNSSDVIFLEEHLMRVREDVSMLWSAIIRERLTRSKDIKILKETVDAINADVEGTRDKENYSKTAENDTHVKKVVVPYISAKLGNVLKAFGLEKKRISSLEEVIHTLKQAVTKLSTKIVDNESKGMALEENIMSTRKDLEVYVNSALDARSHFDEIAQAYCAALSKGWAFSIRRHCEVAPTCNTVCAQAAPEILAAIGNQRSMVKCVNAFTVGNKGGEGSQGTGYERGFGHVDYLSYSYGSFGCQWRANHCGPRHCCCVAY